MKAFLISFIVILVLLLFTAYFLHNQSKRHTLPPVKKELFEDSAGDVYALQSGASQFDTLTKLESDVDKLTVDQTNFSKDFNDYKGLTTQQIKDLDTRTNQYQTDTSSKLTSLVELQKKDATGISEINKAISGYPNDFKSLNDQVTVINGKIVDLTGKHQKDIDTLTKSMDKLQTDYKGYDKVISSQYQDMTTKMNTKMTQLTQDVNTNFSEQSTQIKNLANGVNTVTTNFNAFKTDQDKHNVAQITNVNDISKKATALQQSVNEASQRITDTIALFKKYQLKDEMGNYVSKADLSPYATKTELAEYAKYTQLADYISRDELSTYVPKKEVQPMMDALTAADKALKSLQTLVNTINSSYVTKQDLPKLALDATGVTTLSKAIDGMNAQIKTFSTTLETIQAKFPNYYTKTEIDAKNAAFAKLTDLGVYAKRDEMVAGYYTKTEIDALKKDLLTQISAVQTSSASLASVVTNLEVKGTLKVNQLKAHPQTYDKPLPSGWGGGVHTWDLYANATIAAGQNGGVQAYMNSSGDVVGQAFKSTGKPDGWNWMHVYRGEADQLYFGGDNATRGIWSVGSRPVGIYTNGAASLSVDNNGNTWAKETVDANNVNARTAVKAGGDKAWMRNDGYVYGASWVDGQNVQGRDHVRAGDWKAWMRNDGWMEGDNINAKQYVRAGTDKAWMRNDGYVYGASWIDGQNVKGRDSICVNDVCMNRAEFLKAKSASSTPGPQGPAGPQGPQGPAGPAGSGGSSSGRFNDPVYINQPIYHVRGDPGPLVERNYGQDADRYGVGQWPDGNTRVYAASAYPGKVNLSFARGNNTFYDAQTVHSTGMQVNNANTGDWAWRMNNQSGNRNAYLLHGDGYGMHINTNDQRGDRYAFQLHNNQRELMTVFNGGEIRWNNRNGNWTHFNYPDGKNYIRNETVIDGDTYVQGIKLSRQWTGYPDGGNGNDKSEISNDTNGFKTLMIVGNKSAGAERRVSVWDRLTVNGTFDNRSDEKAKQNIQDVPQDQIQNIDKLRPVNFEWKNNPKGGINSGFIAQDVEKVYPHLVSTDPNGHKNLNYLGILPMLVGNAQNVNKFVNTADKKLCIDDVCISKDDLKQIKAQAKL